MTSPETTAPVAEASDAPIRVAVINDYPVVIKGVAELLTGDPRLSVIEVHSVLVPGTPVDIALFDTYATAERLPDAIARLRADARFRRVAAYTWTVDSRQVEDALAAGAVGFLSKQLDGRDLADALVRMQAGETVVEPIPVTEEFPISMWPGREEGLSAREGEVVGLITQGLTNDQIAERCFLSINSVKSYIRSAYRKMGVERRSQAVLWGVEHGMLPLPDRAV